MQNFIRTAAPNYVVFAAAVIVQTLNMAQSQAVDIYFTKGSDGARELVIAGERYQACDVYIESITTRLGKTVVARIENKWNARRDSFVIAESEIDRLVIYSSTEDDYIANWTDVDADIYSGDGDDEIHSGFGSDWVHAGDGDDFISAYSGADIIYAGRGDDFVDGGHAYGMGGDKRIEGGLGDDHLVGGAEQDVIRGGPGDDIIHGGYGDDELHGDSGNDEIDGYDGFDLLAGGTGVDELDGGDGLDTLIIDSSDILVELDPWENLVVKFFYQMYVDARQWPEYAGNLIVYPWRYED